MADYSSFLLKVDSIKKNIHVMNNSPNNFFLIMRTLKNRFNKPEACRNKTHERTCIIYITS